MGRWEDGEWRAHYASKAWVGAGTDGGEVRQYRERCGGGDCGLPRSWHAGNVSVHFTSDDRGWPDADQLRFACRHRSGPRVQRVQRVQTLRLRRGDSWSDAAQRWGGWGP